MENYNRMNVSTLKNLARERGPRGYSRLRKSQLLQRLGASRDQILDQEIDARMVNVPFLTQHNTHPHKQHQHQHRHPL